MSADQAAAVEVDVALVKQLLADQYPQWEALTVTPVDSGGTDNAIFRLGDSMSVRMPKVEWSVGQVDKEQRWLPYLAPRLTLPIPEPVAMGFPGRGYPWRWSIYGWLEGDVAKADEVGSSVALAQDLALFVRELHAVDATGGPEPGPHNFDRGLPLAGLDQETSEAIADLEAIGGLADVDRIREVWASSLALPKWEHAPVWVHGDLQAGNILLRDGRLAAVLDFGGLGVGDPACDLLVGWNLFSGAARQAYFDGVGADDATWARGRAWAFAVAVIQLPYYHTRRPRIAANATHVIGQVLESIDSE
ncbi:aminoglycoside phosphotransferase family protein [Amycolatopsis sp. NPDC051102]|uniref:aminoglycoside phosphotransferase family protein n=1 Tax=Amycolatopsis sp. NPDC051102 TaxID=3155163 RepID=UPI00342BE9C5